MNTHNVLEKLVIITETQCKINQAIELAIMGLKNRVEVLEAKMDLVKK